MQHQALVRHQVQHWITDSPLQTMELSMLHMPPPPCCIWQEVNWKLWQAGSLQLLDLHALPLMVTAIYLHMQDIIIWFPGSPAQVAVIGVTVLAASEVVCVAGALHTHL